MIFNMVGGGGGGLKNTDAVLIVSVPTGSTVTATKGGVTLTPTIWVQNADNTLDTAIFSIKASTFDSNAWTVTATLGADSASDTLVINSAKEYDLELSYDRVLFYNGVADSELGSFVSIANTTIGSEITTVANAGTGNYWTSNNKLTIPTKYTTLNFEASVTSYNNIEGYKPYFGITTNKLTPGSVGDQKGKFNAYYSSGITTGYSLFTVDISSFAGYSYYVAMAGVTTTATRKIWLSS